MLFVCSALTMMYMQLWPEFLDIILPLNESRPRRLPFIAEYFVDQERYFYILLLHITTAMCIGIVAFVAATTTLAVYFKHICGMFQIAR